jgi:hypothetical protein
MEAVYAQPHGLSAVKVPLLVEAAARLKFCNSSFLKMHIS